MSQKKAIDNITNRQAIYALSACREILASPEIKKNLDIKAIYACQKNKRKLTAVADDIVELERELRKKYCAKDKKGREIIQNPRHGFLKVDPKKQHDFDKELREIDKQPADVEIHKIEKKYIEPALKLVSESATEGIIDVLMQ